MQEQRAQIARLKERHRSPYAIPELVGRNVLFVNDGTASSTSLIASIESFRLLGAGRIVLAVPDSTLVTGDVEYRVDELVVARQTEQNPALDHPQVA
jgi:predicted phosphoribosyltransferase